MVSLTLHTALVLVLFIGLVYGVCPSGKEFKCNYETCCDGTQYCSEADQMCRFCIEENCYSPNYESMCKDFCNEKFPTSTSFKTNASREFRSSKVQAPTQIQGNHPNTNSWFPQTTRQKGFVAIIAIATAVVIACLAIYTRRNQCADVCRWKGDEENQRNVDRQTMEMTEESKTNIRDSGMSSGNNTPETRRLRNHDRSDQNTSCPMRISTPQNERQGRTNSTKLVTSGN